MAEHDVAPLMIAGGVAEASSDGPTCRAWADSWHSETLPELTPAFAPRAPVSKEPTVANLEIVYRPIAELRPRPNNPRTHSKKQLAQLARSMTEFQFTNPVLTDDTGMIIAGHGRVEAAKLAGMNEVPTIKLSNMSEADIRAYVIADNRLAEQAGWDKKLLAVEFQALFDLGFDVSMTGFEMPAIEAILAEEGGSDDLADAVPEVSKEPPVSRPGDIWQIGPHRLVCGDATDGEVYGRLLGEERAGMVFVDAPYNVPVNGHVSGLGKVQHREFAMASGEMSSEEFTGFLCRAFCHLAKHSRSGSIHFQCMDWRHLNEMLATGRMAYQELKNICVWAKTNGGMGSLYRSAHELVFVWKVGTEPHINNVELGKHGRYRTNVWTYPGANSFGATREEDLANHPTVKPAAMVQDAIFDCSNRDDIVLDAFAGSGTTLIAAEKTGRRGYGIEIDPAYCDIIVRRLESLSKHKAVLLSDGRSFEAVALERCAILVEEV